MNADRNASSNQDRSPKPASQVSTLYNAQITDADDDDMDFEPSTTEDSEYFEADDDENPSGVEYDLGEDDGDDVEVSLGFHDAAEEPEGDDDSGPGGAGEIQLNVEHAADGSIHVTQAATEGGPPAPIISRAQILGLLNTTNLRRLLELHGGGGVGLVAAADEEDGDDTGWGRRRRRRNPRGEGVPLPPVPNPEGEKLMGEGVFGRNEDWEDAARTRKKSAARRLMMRELGLDGFATPRENEHVSQYLIPSSSADKIIHYNNKCYSGQFSDDGNFFFCCSQDFNVRMYDTSNIYDWKLYKTVHYPFGQWTITDATLGPDNKFLAYSSIRSAVCLASTDPNDGSEPWRLDFADSARPGGGRRLHAGSSHFGIWSIRFSGDGREIVAGTGDNSVNVYDLDANKTILRIPAHQDDVNAVCYGDQASPHILYSGSDDTLIKVWDRRSMGDNRAAGVFVGHTEGLTYVDSRGDGRYVLSNGKDQTMKLWDLRKMMSTDEAAQHNWRKFTTNFDYRFMPYDADDYRPHPHDCSLVTFRGHRVLRTLIRCHFSPPASTNSRYVYSGSEDGAVHVYNLDATLAGKIDVKEASFESRPKDPTLFSHAWAMDDRSDTWQTCVRDASWHPNAPMIAATSWNGWGAGTGTCTIHSWNDGADDDESEEPMGLRVNDRVQVSPYYYETANPERPRDSRRSRLGSRRVGRRAADEDDDDW